MISIFKETFKHWQRHNAPRMGAALSYYAMLSFIPLLLLLVTLVSYLFSKDLVQGTIVSELAHSIGRNAAQYIDELLRTIAFENISVVTAIIGAVVALIGAVGVFSELDNDFDVLWDNTVSTPVRSFWGRVRSYLKRKIIALSFIPLLTILLLVSIIGTTFFATLQTMITLPSFFVVLIKVVQFAAPLILGTILFMVMYRILPNRTLPWSVLMRGALVTTILFIIGNFLVLSYIKLLVNTDVFGGAASLVGLLVWVYYSAQIFFFGASFTYVYAKSKGLIEVSRDQVQS